SFRIFTCANHSSKLDRDCMKNPGAFGTRGKDLVGVRGFPKTGILHGGRPQINAPARCARGVFHAAAHSSKLDRDCMKSPGAFGTRGKRSGRGERIRTSGLYVPNVAL